MILWQNINMFLKLIYFILYRIGLLEATITLGMMLGSLSSSYIFNATSYVTVYVICGVATLLGLLYTKFFIPESVTSINTQVSVVFNVYLYLT